MAHTLRYLSSNLHNANRLLCYAFRLACRERANVRKLLKSSYRFFEYLSEHTYTYRPIIICNYSYICYSIPTVDMFVFREYMCIKLIVDEHSMSRWRRWFLVCLLERNVVISHKRVCYSSIDGWSRSNLNVYFTLPLLLPRLKVVYRATFVIKTSYSLIYYES